jgi:hypothetical protein
MIRAVALLVLLASPAAAAESTVAARAEIVDPAALRLAWPTAMPNVTQATEGVEGAQFTGDIPAIGMAMTLPANARLVIRRVDDTGGVVTAPTGFQVSAGDGHGLVVRTASSANSSARTERLIVNGALAGRSAASIGVARGAELAANDTTLAVVVQYN